MYIREHKPCILPFVTFMTSPLGIPFFVLESNYHSNTHLQVTGVTLPDYFINQQEFNNTSDQICYEINRIMGSFLYPEIGFEVTRIPGMLEMSVFEYKNQTVTPPLNAWIKLGLSNAANLMCKSHLPCLHSDNDCVSPESEQMHELLCMSNRRCEMTTSAYHLTKAREDVLQTNARGDALALSDFAKI